MTELALLDTFCKDMWEHISVDALAVIDADGEWVAEAKIAPIFGTDVWVYVDNVYQMELTEKSLSHALRSTKQQISAVWAIIEEKKAHIEGKEG